MASTISIDVLNVNVNSIEWSTSGSNKKIAATEIAPYIIMLGYEPEKISFSGNIKSTGAIATRSLVINNIYTVTVDINDFPEFREPVTQWYLTSLNTTQNSGYGDGRVDCDIELIKYYGAL